MLQRLLGSVSGVTTERHKSPNVASQESLRQVTSVTVLAQKRHFIGSEASLTHCSKAGHDRFMVELCRRVDQSLGVLDGGRF
jgi:hypothetical protein